MNTWIVAIDVNNLDFLKYYKRIIVYVETLFDFLNLMFVFHYFWQVMINTPGGNIAMY